MSASWLSDPEPEFSFRRRIPKIYLLIPALIIGCLLIVLVVICRDEMATSKMQADWFSYYDSKISFSMRTGPNPALQFPNQSPYNQRLGYSAIPYFTKGLLALDYSIAAQEFPSQMYQELMTRGLYPIYHPKPTAGLTIIDRRGIPLFNATYPRYTFDDYSLIPPLVISTLLFIENRELLKPHPKTYNPVIEWNRLLFVIFEHLIPRPGPTIGGGSTLATQLEKFRFSQGGQTSSGSEKLRQLISASFRVYLDGPNTEKARQHIILDYLNNTPLSARTGFGEINGLNEGLIAWFGIDPKRASEALTVDETTPLHLKEKAHVFRAVLSLILAQRRPNYYLQTDRWALIELTDATLIKLAEAHIISSSLKEATLEDSLTFIDEAPNTDSIYPTDLKYITTLRNHLLSILGLHSLYELDRVDLSVHSTLDESIEADVLHILNLLNDRAFLKSNGFYGSHLLTPANDPQKINWSVVLYENTPDGNKIRVQADTLTQSYDMNDAIKLDLGSTAKLRTLISYLEIMSELYRRFAGLTEDDLRELIDDQTDALTRWASGWLAHHPKASMEQMLEASLERPYSGHTEEVFFTGGGYHRFSNFEKSEDQGETTIREGFAHSVNLVFVRLLRDIINYTMAQGVDAKQDILDDPHQPERRAYLERFVIEESTTLLSHYRSEYTSLSPLQMVAHLIAHAHKNSFARMLILRSSYPSLDLPQTLKLLKTTSLSLPQTRLELSALFNRASPERYSFGDRGYLTGLNPLELWYVSYLISHGNVTFHETLEASKSIQHESYNWLFNPRLKQAQDSRIRIILEQDSFSQLQKRWARLGYPFTHLVPSLATALGTSSDRPIALAELMGIIVNDGVLKPTVRFETFEFGQDSPFQTLFFHNSDNSYPQVLDPSIARVVRHALLSVVDHGTAQRLKNIYVDPAHHPLQIGGKTGTGEQRVDEFGPGGIILSSRTLNRTGTFVFYIGDRYFGTITAHVSGITAEQYSFSSALAVQLLTVLKPTLNRLLTEPLSFDPNLTERALKPTQKGP